MATTPSSSSITSPVPLMTSEVSLSATASRASSFPKRRSVRQSLANSTAARSSWPCFSSLVSNSSNRVKASAAAPANPASTWPSLPRRRTLRALAFMTVLPRVTCPSPAMATLSPRRTETMVVAWNTWGFWLGSMRPPGVELPVWGPLGTDARVPSIRGWLAAGARMGGVVDAREVAEVQVCVDLGGGDVGVAEQFLHAAQVAGGFKHVAGERMPQQVGDRKSVV